MVNGALRLAAVECRKRRTHLFWKAPRAAVAIDKSDGHCRVEEKLCLAFDLLPKNHAGAGIFDEARLNVEKIVDDRAPHEIAIHVADDKPQPALLGRSDLGGKTGTTNDFVDAWFAGYQPGLVAIAWIGFDNPRSLGRNETGSQAALPIWMGYIAKALKGVPEQPFEMPPGITTARIDKATGQLAPAGDPNSMLEVFKVEDVARLAAGPNNATEEEKKVQQDAYGIF